MTGVVFVGPSGKKKTKGPQEEAVHSSSILILTHIHTGPVYLHTGLYFVAVTVFITSDVF